jgi:hypothetical protein
MMMPCGVLFISLSLGRKRNEPKRKAAGGIYEAKNRVIFPKTAKRASLERGRFFTENRPIFFTPLRRGRNFIRGEGFLFRKGRNFIREEGSFIWEGWFLFRRVLSYVEPNLILDY